MKDRLKANFEIDYKWLLCGVDINTGERQVNNCTIGLSFTQPDG